HIGGVVRGAFAAGKLSGKYFDQPPRLDPADVRGNWFDAAKLQRDFTKFVAFKELISPQRTMPQLALRFLLDEPTTHTIILGAKSFDEYADAATATEIAKLSSEEVRKVGEIRNDLAGRG